MIHKDSLESIKSDILGVLASQDAPGKLPTMLLERRLAELGIKHIAGVDEVGRGSLAGPLSVALVSYSATDILSDDFLVSIPAQDSKKISLKMLLCTISQSLIFSFWLI